MGKINMSLPEGETPDSTDFNKAIEILKAKVDEGTKKKAKKVKKTNPINSKKTKTNKSPLSSAAS